MNPGRKAVAHVCALVLIASVPLMLTPAMAVETVPLSNKSVQVEAGKGTLLRLEQTPTTVFIADPSVADIDIKSPRLLYILGKAPGETSLYAVDAAERVIFSRRIRVNFNVSRLKQMIQELAPGSQVDVNAVGKNLVLTGNVATPADSESIRQLADAAMQAAKGTNLVNRLNVVAPNQVNLRVRFAEVSRSVMKEFGINWDAMFAVGATPFFYGLSTGSSVLKTTPFFGGGAKEFNSRNNGTNSLMGFFLDRRNDVNAIIDALEDEGLVTILAEPNLTALSGEKATFHAGGEFPLLVPGTGTSNTVTVTFKQFGVKLEFTPTIIGDNRINLKLKPEVSELSTAGQVTFNGFSIPSITTRKTETTVELGSGQSFAIAGLVQSSVTRSMAEFPGLGDLPVLGALFRSDSFQRKETELVVIVTPYLVRPVANQRIATPGKEFKPPTDVDRIMYGRIYRTSLDRRRRGPYTRGAQGLEGPSGFVLD